VDLREYSRGQSMKVLIVDDSSVMRRVIEAVLRASGLNLAEVLQASNGKEALAVLEKLAAQGKPPDLILCDIHMPVMDGIGFLSERKRRALSPHAVVIMITADPSDPLLIEAAAEGGLGHIAKPFTSEQLQTRIVSLLRDTGEGGGACPAGPASSVRQTMGGAPSTH
jgi:CheY-like chemotaxis protein